MYCQQQKNVDMMLIKNIFFPCRTDICVPRGGVKDFPPNFYINCIQDELGSRPYFGICDVCERDWLVSQYRCVNCDLDICKFCIHDHRLFKHEVGNDAQIMRIETGNMGPNLASQRNCELHSEEALHMFCLTCDKLVCMTCVCETHKKHDTMPLVKKLNLAKKHLQFDMDHMHNDLIGAQNSLELLTGLRDKVEKDRDDCVKAIRAHARDLTLEIDKLAENKITKLIQKAKGSIQDIDSYRKEMSQFNQHVERGSRFLEDLNQEDMSIELIDCFQKYQKTVDDMKKSVMNKSITHQLTEFTPGKVRRYQGYTFFHFGKVLEDKHNKMFMIDATKAARWQKVGKFLKLFTIRNFLVLVMLIMIVLTISQLSLGLYQDSELCTKHAAGLVFFVYISVASVCAYLKSSP